MTDRSSDALLSSPLLARIHCPRGQVACTRLLPYLPSPRERLSFCYPFTTSKDPLDGLFLVHKIFARITPGIARAAPGFCPFRLLLFL